MTDPTPLFTPAMFDDPYPVYARLRAEAPVHHAPQVGLWLVSRYDDVQHVLRSVDTFSSARTTALDRLQDPRLRESINLLTSGSLIAVDPPDHTRLRRLINVAFTPRAIARLEARIREVTGALVDAIVRRPSFDLMEDFAVPLPVIVIAELLGVDPARRAEFKRWSDDLLRGSNLDPRLDDVEVDRIRRSRQDFVDFFREMIAQRRQTPRDDLLSDLVRAEAEHDKLSPDEALNMAVLLMIAGNETTTNLIGNATADVLDQPAALQRLRDDPSLIPGFLEEALRYRSPVTMLVRTTTREVALGGVTLPAGAVVAPLIDSANHDPARFPEPGRFDITRHPAHLSFGHGIHFCVGAPLTRLEGRVAFEELLARLPPFAREPGPLDWNRTFSLRGLRSLRLRFTDARPRAA